MSDIRVLIGKQNSYYKSIVSAFCPLLNDTVYFTSEGFHHLLYKSSGKRRTIDEQYLKLKCLTHAPPIVQNSTRIIETRKEERMIKGKKKSVVTYELVDGQKRKHNIAVVVERIGTGKHKFRSVKRISRKRYNK